MALPSKLKPEDTKKKAFDLIKALAEGTGLLIVDQFRTAPSIIKETMGFLNEYGIKQNNPDEYNGKFGGQSFEHNPLN
ncbi:hypothetical protein [Marinobacter alexandrii]|uniref:hypothetical protein n=1 Tax=Marinobacter alexandrii TaxID=2570351 RepID=UPI00326708F8